MGEIPLNRSSKLRLSSDEDIVCTSGEKPEKFIRELHGVTTHVNIQTALTGFIVPKCKIYGNGFFSNVSYDPDGYTDYLGALKHRLHDDSIDEIKSAIEVRKEARLRINDQYLNMRTLEVRDGCFVIHKRYRILEDQSQNMTIISARNPIDCHYVRTYVDKNGMTKTEDDLAVIKRRKELVTENGYYKISARGLTAQNKTIDSTVTATSGDKN